MSKKLVLMKPFKSVKCYSLALADEIEKSVASLLYIQKSSLLTDEEYVKLMEQLKISASPNYIPNLVADVKPEGTIPVGEKKK